MDSASQLTKLSKDYQSLAALNNELSETGTNLTLYVASKNSLGNMIRSTNRLRKEIPATFSDWNSYELLNRKITEKQIEDGLEKSRIQVGELFDYPLVIITPLRSHRKTPTHSSKKSCKALQITILKKILPIVITI